MFSYLPNPVSAYWRFPIFAPAKDREYALTGTIQSERVDWLPRPPPPDFHRATLLWTEPGKHPLPRDIRRPLLQRPLPHPRHSPSDELISPAVAPATQTNAPETQTLHMPSSAYPSPTVSSLNPPSNASTTPAQATTNPTFCAPILTGTPTETLKGVLLSIVADYLDGNLEMIRTFLQAISDLNPSLKLSDDNINSACRACLLALHAELIRVLELQYAFRHLPYLDFTGRSRLTIQLIRITLSLPVTLEKAVQEAWKEDVWADEQWSTANDRDEESDKAALLPKHVVLLIRGIDVILDRMERVLG
ncbi:hypothetical protein JVU11DRAFT_4205 [Chiua virens]|nr:hypothetical protein JVU11DRAFT_4205 [Chiua virens]